MSITVRVRFAPSPTGYLHIGGARTALFNWLYARHHKGVFMLRIEDTDRERSTQQYIDEILRGMEWLQLVWDEGPYRQTDRFGLYTSYVNRLIEENKAYYCYCSPEELEARRREAMAHGRPLKYNGRCRNLGEPVPSVKPVVRFKMPQYGLTVVDDLIRGRIEFNNEQLDDLIILRSDGSPTYNLTVVVDDVDMKITHVIRGDDHLNNTPKQINLYEAFGYQIPTFAHLPLILGSDKSRLSKRHGATSVTAYRDMGYLPEALVNYLVRLGWSHGDQEIFSLDELIEHFSLDHVGKAAAVFNSEKLLWLNAQYMMKSDPEMLCDLVMPFLVSEGIISQGHHLDKQWMAKAVRTLRERVKTLVELAQSLRFYLAENIEYDEKAKKKFLTRDNCEVLTRLKEGLQALADFKEAEIENLMRAIAERIDVKLGKIAQPARVALTGGTASPGIFEVISILGKDKVLQRLARAIAIIENKE